MSEVPVKKKHQSGSEKRKKPQEQQNKLNEQLKKTQNLFKLGFSRESKEHQPHDSPSTSSASHTMVVDPVEVPCEPFEQIGQDQETATLVGAEESEAETEVIHQNVVHLGVEYQNDIGLWQNITNEMQDFWCTRDPNECQHFECDFSASSRQYDDSKRFFSQSIFFRKHISGGKIKREWLMYSPSTGKVYCFPCILFGEAQNRSHFQTGFSDWKNALHRIQSHENNATHRTKANEKTDTQYSDENQRVRKRKRHHDDGPAKEVVLRGKEKLKVDTYLPVLDILCTELSRRLEAYREINDLFGFLTDFSTKSDAEIRQACTKFKEHYLQDIESEFINEMVQYKYFILQLEDAGKKIVPAEESYNLIIVDGDKKTPFFVLLYTLGKFSKALGQSKIKPKEAEHKET
ncbi:TTF-type domain-containing protein [Trichonephila clavata]|uniref:TTF-type domain-containing protein n=1 Tax=Trichonephila clavata TaxID=2740835 RepID=A0A8X6LNE4_TRICU|nr:TTF-type domain-containing protein [Trichonephila clavata]